jgi:hypothetical protein
MDGLERRGVLKLIESLDDLTLKLAYEDLTKLRQRGSKDSYIQGFIYIIEDEMKVRAKF